MTTIEQSTVRARIATPVKDEAEVILREKGLTLSEVLRETLLRVIDLRDVPFPVRNPTGHVVDTSRSLARINYDAGMKLLPELHQARWAEHYGELHSDKRSARAAGDSGKVKELEQAISDHLKTRYDTSGTRELIEAQYRRELAAEQLKEISARLAESEGAFKKLAEHARSLAAEVAEASGSITTAAAKKHGHARHI